MKIRIVNSAIQIERDIADALRQQIPVKDLPGVSIRGVQEQPEQPFDIGFELRSGANRVLVLAEIRPAFSPRLLEEIAPWIQRLKSLRDDVAVAVIAPALSSQAQAFCMQNAIDFMDLAGNIFINLPGKFTLQRIGMKSRDIAMPVSKGQRTINVFSGRSSRILRVLLEKPKTWSITDISREIVAESARFRSIAPAALVEFEISLGSVSKAIATLEDQLFVRRRGADVVVPEPSRLLVEWAEKYKERYRWRLRSSFQTGNPFGRDLQSISAGLEQLAPGTYVFSGAMAASLDAPFVDIETADIFLTSGGRRSSKALHSGDSGTPESIPRTAGSWSRSTRLVPLARLSLGTRNPHRSRPAARSRLHRARSRHNAASGPARASPRSAGGLRPARSPNLRWW